MNQHRPTFLVYFFAISGKRKRNKNMQHNLAASATPALQAE